MPEPYDGRPYYCNTCGEQFSKTCKDNGGECVIESAAAAELRQRRKRPAGSDAAAFKPKD